MARNPFRASKPQKQTYGRHNQSRHSQDFLNSLLLESRKTSGDQESETLPSPPAADREGRISSSALAFTPRPIRSPLPSKLQKTKTRSQGKTQEDRNKHPKPTRLSHISLKIQADSGSSHISQQFSGSVNKDKKMRALAKIRPENTRHRLHLNENSSVLWRNFADINAKRHQLKPPVLKSLYLDELVPEKPIPSTPSSRAIATSPEHRPENPSGTASELYFGPRPRYASPIEQLPDQILLKICTMVCDLGAEVFPFYQQGILARGVLSNPNNDLGVIQQKNVEVSLLRVSKTLNEFGTAALYKLPRFVFNDPDACRWWLCRIGSNFPSVSDLKLVIGSGWLNSPDGTPLDRSPFWGRCKEEKWHDVFNQITKNHNLSRLELVLLNEYKLDMHHSGRWATPTNAPHTEEDRSKLFACRKKLISLMRKYLRGVRMCIIQDASAGWLNHGSTQSLAFMVCKSKDTAAERPPKVKLSLPEALTDARRRGKQQTAITDEELEELEGSAHAGRHPASVH